MTDAGRPSAAIRVFCVDDNPEVRIVLRTRIAAHPRLVWAGHRDCAAGLVEAALAARADVIVLDMDMPGPGAMDALRELSERASQLRPIVFTGQCRRETIELALERGAWGFVAKHDGEIALIHAIMRVVEGEVALSREAADVLASPVQRKKSVGDP